MALSKVRGEYDVAASGTERNYVALNYEIWSLEKIFVCGLDNASKETLGVAMLLLGIITSSPDAAGFNWWGE